jgi:hypothetical protein
LHLKEFEDKDISVEGQVYVEELVCLEKETQGMLEQLGLQKQY